MSGVGAGVTANLEDGESSGLRHGEEELGIVLPGTVVGTSSAAFSGPFALRDHIADQRMVRPRSRVSALRCLRACACACAKSEVGSHTLALRTTGTPVICSKTICFSL
jgi:hypothetical protein